MTDSDYDVIWLAPLCPRAVCDHQEITEEDCGRGRLWCEHDAWGACNECGARPTRYVRDKRTGKERADD